MLFSNWKSGGNALSQFPTCGLVVEQYQSIDDTIVQLFISQASVLITRVDGIQFGMASVVPAKIMACYKYT